MATGVVAFRININEEDESPCSRGLLSKIHGKGAASSLWEERWEGERKRGFACEPLKATIKRVAKECKEPLMIKVKNLTKRFGETLAVDNLSFEVERGEVLGFLGPNGAGKTTTMRILTCFLPATSGEAKVDGLDVFDQSLEVRKRLGYMPENAPLYYDMRVDEYLNYRASLKEVPKRERKRHLEEAMDRCGILDVRRRIVGHLSKGYRQRVALAASMVHTPSIYILDEPTIGLDPNQIREIRNLIKALGGDHTVLLSTHILPEVEMVCQRVIIIDKGRVVAQDTPEGLQQQLQRGGTILLEVRGEGARIAQALKAIPGVGDVQQEQKGEIVNLAVHTRREEDLREEISRTIFQQQGIIREMRSKAMTLEEIFVHITTTEKGGEAGE